MRRIVVLFYGVVVKISRVGRVGVGVWAYSLSLRNYFYYYF